MSQAEGQPILSSQTTAQNEAVETVLSRYDNKELVIPPYQRDADQWDDVKKSLFIESILNRLTIPAFYVANRDNDDTSEVVDGQQRLTTLSDFSKGRLTLLGAEECPYYGDASAHYAGKRYDQLGEPWQRAFRRYTLSLVTLPANMELSLRLEVFRRINEGGTPLSGQDIRLGYYSTSPTVRFIQTVGVTDATREGAKRIISDSGDAWPWSASPEVGNTWTEWWQGSRSALGQTPSEMFLWYLVSRYRKQLDDLLKAEQHLSTHLRLRFRENTQEVLDIYCAQTRYEDEKQHDSRLLPSKDELRTQLFPEFNQWWYAVRTNCGPHATAAKHRAIALLIPGLALAYNNKQPTKAHWTLFGKFLDSLRATARDLGVEFPEPKGKWRSQRKQLDAFDNIAAAISNK